MVPTKPDNRRSPPIKAHDDAMRPMSNPDVKDEAGERALLIERLRIVIDELNANNSIAIMVDGHLLIDVYNALIAADNARAIRQALSADANDKRIADLEAQLRDVESHLVGLLRACKDAAISQIPASERPQPEREALTAMIKTCAEFMALSRAAESQLRLTGTEDAGVRALVGKVTSRLSYPVSTEINPRGYGLHSDADGERAEMAVELLVELRALTLASSNAGGTPALQESHETMRAEMRRDEITRKPTWFCSESDGRGEISELEVVELAAELFPEGTFVRITEPSNVKKKPGGLDMATVTIEPAGYAIATYFTERRDEFERDGTVIYHAPMGMATSPLFTSDALAQARAEGKAEGMRDGPATHRHKKRGSEYVLIGYGKMQAERWHQRVGEKANTTVDQMPTVDMREVAIYRAVDDGSMWVRPREEFEDGRFEALLPPANGEGR